jgi:ribonuclease BN (tRNA processing enzyme)
MELIVLGSGTSVPHPTRASAAFWVTTRTGSLLLDVSAAAPHRMAQENLPWPDLDAIWISHFHLDHSGGLAPFLFGTKWAPQTLSRTKPLRIYGGVGLRKVIEAFDTVGNYRLLQQKFPIEIVEIQAKQKFDILPELQARTFSTPHTAESLAVRLTANDRTSLVYTADTGPSSELIEFCRGATLLLLECSFRKNKPVANHLELSEAMEVARASQPRRLVLTHLYPEWDGFDISAEAGDFWDGETIEARDGLRLLL